MATVFHFWWGDEELALLRYDAARQCWLRFWRAIRTLDSKLTGPEIAIQYRIIDKVMAALQAKLDPQEQKEWIAVSYEALGMKPPSRSPKTRVRVLRWFYRELTIAEQQYPASALQARYSAEGWDDHPLSVKREITRLQNDEKAVADHPPPRKR